MLSIIFWMDTFLKLSWITVFIYSEIFIACLNVMAINLCKLLFEKNNSRCLNNIPTVRILVTPFSLQDFKVKVILNLYTRIKVTIVYLRVISRRTYNWYKLHRWSNLWKSDLCCIPWSRQQEELIAMWTQINKKKMFVYSYILLKVLQYPH